MSWVQRSKPRFLQPRVHGGEALSQELALQMARVQPHVVGLVPVEHPLHVPHHHVPRSQLRPRMRPHHEPLPRVVEQVGALAPQSLGQQQGGILAAVEGRGMELHELHVPHHRAGPVGHGVPVAGGHPGVGGVREDLAGAATGQHHGPGQADGQLAFRDPERPPPRSGPRP